MLTLWCRVVMSNGKKSNIGKRQRFNRYLTLPNAMTSKLIKQVKFNKNLARHVRKSVHKFITSAWNIFPVSPRSKSGCLTRKHPTFQCQMT